MNSSVIVVGLYICTIFLISWYTKHRAAGKAENYILAGRQLTTPLIMVSIVGLAVGGASTIALPNRPIKPVFPPAGTRRPGASARSSWA